MNGRCHTDRATQVQKAIEEIQRAFARLGYAPLPLWGKYKDLMDALRDELDQAAQKEDR